MIQLLVHLPRHIMEVRISASNFLSIFNQEVMDYPEMWNTFLKCEVNFCKEPEAIDEGTRMITIVQRT